MSRVSRALPIPGLGLVGRLQLVKPATNDPWAGLKGRVGRSGRAPAQRWGFAPPPLRCDFAPPQIMWGYALFVFLHILSLHGLSLRSALHNRGFPDSIASVC